MTDQKTRRPIPADGVEFELTLDAPIDPLEMLRSDGYNPRGWKFRGSKVTPQTHRFILVRERLSFDIAEIREKLKQHGSIPVGQWREPFKQTFPHCDGRGPIGFADPSWEFPHGCARFPVLIESCGGGWCSGFTWHPIFFDQHWRWLVEVGK